MKHFIEFRADVQLTFEKGGISTVCQFRFGEQCQATVRCYVAYRKERYVEVADVEFKEGKLSGFPCSHFMFIDLMG